MLGCTLGVAASQLDGRRRSLRPGDGHRQPHGRGPGLRGGGCTFRLGAAIEREPAARQHLEVPRSRAPAMSVSSSPPADSRSSSTARSGSPRLEQGGGEVCGSLRRVEAARRRPAEIDALLRGGECEVHVPAPQRGGRAAKQRPPQRVRVAQQPRRLDAAVEQLAPTRPASPLAQQPAERRDQERGRAPPGRWRGPRPGHDWREPRLGIPVEVELDAGQPGRASMSPASSSSGRNRRAPRPPHYSPWLGRRLPSASPRAPARREPRPSWGMSPSRLAALRRALGRRMHRLVLARQSALSTITQHQRAPPRASPRRGAPRAHAPGDRELAPAGRRSVSTPAHERESLARSPVLARRHDLEGLEKRVRGFRRSRRPPSGARARAQEKLDPLLRRAPFADCRAESPLTNQCAALAVRKPRRFLTGLPEDGDGVAVRLGAQRSTW